MTNTMNSSTEVLARCPQCWLVPIPTFEDSGKVTFQCPCQRHMAMGDNLEKAVTHWNLYITYVTITHKSNPEPEMKLQ